MLSPSSIHLIHLHCSAVFELTAAKLLAVCAGSRGRRGAVPQKTWLKFFSSNFFYFFTECVLKKKFGAKTAILRGKIFFHGRENQQFTPSRSTKILPALHILKGV